MAKKARRPSPFFVRKFWRHSYIVFAHGSKRDQPVEEFTVHGLFFSFVENEAHRMDRLSERVEEIAKKESEERGMYGLRIEGNIEVEEVGHEEAVGIGFYRAQILVDDSEYETFDLRFG